MSDLEFESLICHESLDSLLDPFELAEEEQRTQQVLDSEGWLHTTKRGYNERVAMVCDAPDDVIPSTSNTPVVSQQWNEDDVDGGYFHFSGDLNLRSSFLHSTPAKQIVNNGKSAGEHLGGEGRSGCYAVKCLCECEGDKCKTPPFTHCNIVDDITWRAVTQRVTAPAAVLEQHTAASGIRKKMCVKKKLSPQGRAQVVTGAPSKEVVCGQRLRLKPGRMFFITLSLLFGQYSSVRLDFLNSLLDFGIPLISYCICLERSDKSDIVDYHLHCFIELQGKIIIEELRSIIISLWPDHGLDIQPCRSKKSCLKYIIKEDTHLLTNIKKNLLNFNYQCYCWAERTGTFDHTDPFVVEHRFNYRFLEKYLAQHKLKSLNSFIGFKKYENHTFNLWTRDCANWWNQWVECIDSNKKTVKRSQLYLWGGTNMGKSTFIELLIGRQNLKYVFYPGVGKFFMQGFQVDVHKIIVFEEFNMTFYHAMLKRLLEGRDYAYPVKCGLDMKFKFRGPIIFVSNFNICDQIDDRALIGRLINIHSDVFYKYGSLEEEVVCKEEALSETSYEEVVEISSASANTSMET